MILFKKISADNLFKQFRLRWYKSSGLIWIQTVWQFSWKKLICKTSDEKILKPQNTQRKEPTKF